MEKQSDTTTLVRERSGVQISAAAPFTALSYKVLGDYPLSYCHAEPSKNGQAPAARNWQEIYDRAESEYWLYRYYDAGGGLLYVGMSVEFLTRDKSHFERKRWRRCAAFVRVENFATQKMCEWAEIHAIKAENPKYNILRKHPPQVSTHLFGNYFKECGGYMRGEYSAWLRPARGFLWSSPEFLSNAPAQFQHLTANV